MHGWFYPILFITALIAGLVDAIAGGGGLITLPVLLGSGIPAHMVLGTNKFQSSFGSFTATRHYVQEGVAGVRTAVAGIVWTFIGAALGAYAVQQIDPAFLARAIPWLLLAIAIYTIATPKFGDADAHARMHRQAFYALFGLSLGFYDGFFGPGVGSFWAVLFVTVLGMNLRTATGYTKVMNFTSNVVSLGVFLIGGNVDFMAGSVMAAGQILGSRIGAGMVVRRGASFVRPVFIVVVILTTLKLLWR